MTQSQGTPSPPETSARIGPPMNTISADKKTEKTKDGSRAGSSALHPHADGATIITTGELAMHMFGFHAVYEKGFGEAIRLASGNGFGYVQFDLNVPRFYIDRLATRELKELRRLASDSGVSITFHAPGDYVGLFTDQPAILKGIREHFAVILGKANILGARHLVLHPLSQPSFGRADTLSDGIREEYAGYFRDILASNLAYLAERAGSVLVCVENCHFSGITMAALEKVFSARTDVFLTLDYAKMHMSGLVPDPEQYAFFVKHKSRIRELHLHDMNRGMKSHLAPGQGNLDFGNLFRDFSDENAWLTIEVRPFAMALEARTVFEKTIKRLTPDRLGEPT